MLPEFSAVRDAYLFFTIFGLLFGYFLILLWSVRFFVEYVKESQGGIEETFGLLSTGQWLSIPFILIGIYYLFVAEKPVDEE